MKLSNKFQSSNSNAKLSKGKRDSIQENYDVFGKELKTLVEVRQLPELICMFGYVIKNFGVLSQGLFRVSGNKTRMDELRSLYSQSRRLDIGIDDIHNITGLFKSFLRQIPGGIIPCPQSLDLMKATRMYKRNENIDLLTNELLKLPVPHYNLLKYTCSLLNQVSLYSVNNLMTPDNLGTVFGPTFFSSVEDVSLLQLANSASTVLIQHYDHLFKVSAPVHTNFNQTKENIQCFDTDSSNDRLTKTITDHLTTIKFGESCLVFNSNEEMGNSLFSFPIHNDESLTFPEPCDNFTYNSVIPVYSQFSNSLNMNTRMCNTNHLFEQFHENGFLNSEPIFAPHLISDTMLNPEIIRVYQSSDPRNESFHKLQMQRFEKDQTFDEPTSLPLPHREIASKDINMSSTENKYSQNTSDKMQSYLSQNTSGAMIHNNLLIEELINLKLDSSVLYDGLVPENFQESPKSKNQEMVRSNFCGKYNDNKYKPKLSDIESRLSNVRRKSIDVEKHLSTFEDGHFPSSCGRPDKPAIASNKLEIAELKHVQRDKVEFNNGRNKNKESYIVAKEKTSVLCGNVLDNSSIARENRLVQSRPLSSLSEISPSMAQTNRSPRSNTLRLTTKTTPDVSPTELNNLQLAIEKMHDDLKRERMHDNRPFDLNSMSQQQVQAEKISLQKTLLNFESSFGRKKTQTSINLMTTLYDRYRQVKRRLVTMNLKQERDWSESLKATDSHYEPNSFQLAWSAGKPSSRALHSLDRRRMTQYNNLSMFTPIVSEFDIDEEYISNGQPSFDSINGLDSKNRTQFQRKNDGKCQSRRASLDQFNDSNNNKHHSQMGKLMFDLRQLQVEKKELQRVLKDFEIKFEQDTKRKMEKLDRLPMEREYNRYKNIKNRIKEQKEYLENPIL